MCKNPAAPTFCEFICKTSALMTLGSMFHFTHFSVATTVFYNCNALRSSSYTIFKRPSFRQKKKYKSDKVETVLRNDLNRIISSSSIRTRFICSFAPQNAKLCVCDCLMLQCVEGAYYCELLLQDFQKLLLPLKQKK